MVTGYVVALTVSRAEDKKPEQVQTATGPAELRYVVHFGPGENCDGPERRGRNPGLYLKDIGTGGRIITNPRAPALPKPFCSVTYSLDATWRIAADDAPRWVPRGSGSHGPDGVDVAAVAVTPPANRATLHSYRVVPCSRRASR